MRRIKPFAIMTITLGALALGISQFLSQPQDAVPANEELEQNDWYLEKVTSWQLTDDGSLNYLYADTLRQQAEIVYAQQPRIIMIKPEQQVFVRSHQAQISHNTRYQFDHNVEIKQTQTVNQTSETHRLHTEQLNYDQTTEHLSSVLAVTLYTPHSRTQGIGLDLDLKQQRTQIHSQVKTYYELH